MATTLVATRPSGQDPNTQEFYNTQTNTGFSNPSQVFDFAKSQGLVGSRPSAVNPQVSELFNPTSGQGFTNEAEALSFIASQPVPQATNVNIADKVKTPIPAENLTANAVTAGDINKLLADNMKYRDQVMGLFNPTPDEVQAQQDLNAVRQKARETKLNAQAGILQEGNRLAPMTAIQGGQRNIQEQANLQLQTLATQEQPLVDQLNILSSNRQSKLQALQFMISQGQYDITLARDIAKDKKAEEDTARKFAMENSVQKPFYTIDGKTIYNTQTGKGYSDWGSFIADGGDPKLGNVEQVQSTQDWKTQVTSIGGREVAVTLDGKGNVVNRVDLGASTKGGGGNSENNSAAVNLFGGVVEEALANGASPADAVLAAVSVANSTGTNLSLKEQNALLEYANKAKQIKEQAQTSQSTSTPSTTPQKTESSFGQSTAGVKTTVGGLVGNIPQATIGGIKDIVSGISDFFKNW